MCSCFAPWAPIPPGTDLYWAAFLLQVSHFIFSLMWVLQREVYCPPPFLLSGIKYETILAFMFCCRYSMHLPLRKWSDSMKRVGLIWCTMVFISSLAYAPSIQQNNFFTISCCEVLHVTEYSCLLHTMPCTIMSLLVPMYIVLQHAMYMNWKLCMYTVT